MWESRIKRIIEEYGISEKDAEKSLFDVDRARENYYKYHTGRKWGQPSNYHLAINTGYISLDNAVELILDFVDKRNYK